MEELLDCFAPGRRVYLPGGSAEILPLAAALAAEPERLAGVEITAALLPSMNRTDYTARATGAQLTVFMMSPALEASAAAGRLRLLPLCYSATGRYLAQDFEPDVAIAHVAPAGAGGRCSLGISADFAPLVWPRAAFRILVVNARMPAIARAPHLALADADLVVEIDAPLVAEDEPVPDAVTQAIAASVAALVPDGAAVQCGIGGIPGATWRCLAGHRDLVIASGMVTPPLRTIAEAGALREGGGHRAGIALGGPEFYDWLAETNFIEMVPVTQSHDSAALARLDAFTSINSALELDLFGQVNLEWRGTTAVSGVGGAPDFARAAFQSRGGRAITALRATAGKGAISRIVPRLVGPTVSLPRSDVDTVVTEYGIADLRGRSTDERAAALIAIAAPDHRDALERAWRPVR
ncbi:MAG: acetyl-CoA hydrolase [Sphingopyxis sp.]|nr:acetyl-CoA hydrolase [Sphingopyxis sp.]